MAIENSFDFKNITEVDSPREKIHAADLYGMIGNTRGFGVISGCSITRSTNTITVGSGDLFIAGSVVTFVSDSVTIDDTGMSSGQYRWTAIYITPSGDIGTTNGTPTGVGGTVIKPTDTTNFVIAYALKTYGTDLTDDDVIPAAVDLSSNQYVGGTLTANSLTLNDWSDVNSNIESYLESQGFDPSELEFNDSINFSVGFRGIINTAGTVLVRGDGSAIIDIDYDDNQSDSSFQVRTNAGTEILLEITENGNMTVKNTAFFDGTFGHDSTTEGVKFEKNSTSLATALILSDALRFYKGSTLATLNTSTLKLDTVDLDLNTNNLYFISGSLEAFTQVKGTDNDTVHFTAGGSGWGDIKYYIGRRSSDSSRGILEIIHPSDRVNTFGDNGIYIHSVSNGAGALLTFSDHSGGSYAQKGYLTYYHQDSQWSQGWFDGFRFSSTESTFGVEIDGEIDVKENLRVNGTTRISFGGAGTFDTIDVNRIENSDAGFINIGGDYLTNYSSVTGGGTNVIRNSSSGGLVEESSSRRFKTNEQEWDVDSSLIYQIQPKTWDWSLSNPQLLPDDLEGHRGHGLIAEDIHDIFGRYAVSFNKKGAVQAINYNYLTVVLIHEIQQLNSRIEVLEEK